jgi:hypothetical protein
MNPRNSRRKSDSYLLRVAERSNGLAFSHHHFASSSQQRSLYDIDVKTPAGPREELAVKAKAVEKHSKEHFLAPAQQQRVRSLIPPIVPASSERSRSSAMQQRRNSSSSSIVKSFTSSLQFGPMKGSMAPTPTLAGIPLEMLEAICRFCTQQGLLSLMLCNSSFARIAVQYLYMKPKFASTYRFAQVGFSLAKTL